MKQIQEKNQISRNKQTKKQRETEEKVRTYSECRPEWYALGQCARDSDNSGGVASYRDVAAA